MRRVVLVCVTLAATLSFAVGAIGQQELLLVDLRVEPERMERSITLFDAAVANDFATFDRVYRDAPQPEYAELHRLWTWSMNDPIGAFYGAETFERLASLYPGFRRYIDEYRIVDSHGSTFYPTAETRRFLLRQAVYGVIGRTDIASAPVKPAAAPRAPVAPSPKRAAEPVAPAPRQPAAAVQAIVEAPRPLPLMPPVAQAAPRLEPESVRGAVRRNEADRGALSRSIFLIIAGLLGIGMMTLMLQTPRDEQQPRSVR